MVAGGAEVSVGGGDRRSGWSNSELRPRLLRLTLLAPDIVDTILEGRQPKAMQLEELTDAIPSEWEKQRKSHLSRAA